MWGQWSPEPFELVGCSSLHRQLEIDWEKQAWKNDFMSPLVTTITNATNSRVALSSSRTDIPTDFA
jgi:hypothetical protein